MARTPSFRETYTALIEQLHAKALDSVPQLKGQLTPDELAEPLERSVRSRFGQSSPPAQAVRGYLESLHVGDLALACACALGKETAWEHFMAAFRPALYAAGRAVAGESEGRELADSLYADLYGLKEREGRRQSLFLYFHGRSKLSTWLRAVLAQRHVDSIRSARRTVSLDDDSSAAAELPAHSGSDGSASRRTRAAPATSAAELAPDRERYLHVLQAALTAALNALEPRDRLRLCYYYVQDLTLAQIGRLLGEHEATVSRKLDRIRKDLKQTVDQGLREEKKLTEEQVRLCYEYAEQEWPFDLAGVLSARE